MAHQRVSTMTKCLFCNKRQPSTGEKGECFVEVSGLKQLRKAFWICEQCGISEKDRTRALAGLVLAETKSKASDCTSKDSVVQLAAVEENSAVGRSISKKHSVAENESGAASCSCQACVERKHFEQEQLREVQSLPKYWLQLRHAVRQMYRDRLLRDGQTGKGKKFDLKHLNGLIDRLCARDPHQLYQRLESLGREHVMELKVLLLQILVSPEKVGLMTTSNSESIASNMSQEVAEHFLRSLLNFASQFFETVDNMKEFLAPLEKEHLEKFGITWRIVNCNLFDSVVYHDPLLQATLPSIYSHLGFKITSDDKSDGSVSIILDRKSTPSHVADMMKNFVELGTTLAVCRNRMEEAHERMDKHLAKQTKIYQAILKAKQKILQQDLVFFKSQRRLLEEHMMKKELKKTSSGDENLSTSSEPPGCLLTSRKRSNSEHSASTTECIRCHRSHCPCDQCSISHLIACGLLSDSDVELPDCVPFLDGLDNFSNSSRSDSEDSDYGVEDGCLLDKRLKMDFICQTSISCSGGRKITKVEATILPDLCPTEYASTALIQRQLDNAYGDWDVNVDPSTLLFSSHWEELLLSKCTKEKGRTKKVADNVTTAATTANDSTEPKIKHNGQEVGDKSKKCESGSSMSNCGSPTSEKTVPSSQTLPAKVQACKRHSLTLVSKTAKRSDTVVGSVDTSMKSATPKATCESKEKPDVCLSPRKASLTSTPIRTSQANNCQQQFTQEWFKDPKNAKYAQALLACALTGSNKDMACLNELNLDLEHIKKLYAQHVEASAAAGAKECDNSGCPANGGDAQKFKTTASMKSQRDGESLSADEDDDSWSDHSSVLSQKDKHCDCCYCEMFGHGGKACGRDEYPQIRERLRLKLKKKGSELQSQWSEQIDGYRGDAPLDDVIAYVTGGNTTRNAENEQTKSSAKKKKPQTKSKKKVEKRDQQLSPLPSAVQNNGGHAKPDAEIALCEEKRNIKSESKLKPPSPAQKYPYQNGSVADNLFMESEAASPQPATRPKCDKSRKRLTTDEDVSVDEIFKPKDIDLNSTDLDDEEREVECFKRFVMDCRPRENREKVHLNIGHLLREKKATAAAAMV